MGGHTAARATPGSGTHRENFMHPPRRVSVFLFGAWRFLCGTLEKRKALKASKEGRVESDHVRDSESRAHVRAQAIAHSGRKGSHINF
jgi:hypothetical protein